jgi:hypothetical protein
MRLSSGHDFICEEITDNGGAQKFGSANAENQSKLTTQIRFKYKVSKD